MPSFEQEKDHIRAMLEANGYSVRTGDMPGDDFRLFLVPPGFEVESEEVFKIKDDENVYCGAEMLMGGELRDAFYKQDKEDRAYFREKIKSAEGANGLDFFGVSDNGKDFRVTIRTSFHIANLSEDVFGDAMDRLNIAGGAIEDIWNEYFGNLLG